MKDSSGPAKNISLADRKGSEKFSKMAKELVITKSTIIFKKNLKLKKSSFSMHYFKNSSKQMRAICKASGSNFKSGEP